MTTPETSCIILAHTCADLPFFLRAFWFGRRAESLSPSLGFLGVTELFVHRRGRVLRCEMVSKGRNQWPMKCNSIAETNITRLKPPPNLVGRSRMISRWNSTDPPVVHPRGIGARSFSLTISFEPFFSLPRLPFPCTVGLVNCWDFFPPSLFSTEAQKCMRKFDPSEVSVCRNGRKIATFAGGEGERGLTKGQKEKDRFRFPHFPLAWDGHGRILMKCEQD